MEAETAPTSRLATHAVLPPLSRAFRDFDDEHGFVPLEVTGTLPADLRGTLYRNGPALFSNFGHRYRHWFDGDGSVSAVRFENGRADGAVRVLDTPHLLEERKAGRPLYQNYATSTPSWLRRLGAHGKNTANTSLMMWQGHLYALQEGSRPLEVDPDALRSLGETTFERVVIATFSAHPHWVPGRNEGYGFGVRYGATTKLDVYALPAEGPARRMTTLPIAPTLIHDFIATEKHLVFFAPPLRLRAFRVLLGLEAYADALAWKPSKGTEVIVVPIDAPGRATRFEVDPFYQWHFANAYEAGDEIVVDFVRYPDFRSNAELAALLDDRMNANLDGKLVRARVRPGRKQLTYEPLSDDAGDFPQIAPARFGREHRFVYTAAGAHEGEPLVQVLTKVDTTSGRVDRVDFGARSVVSEPLFVAREGATEEDDGWLLAHAYDRPDDRSRAVVLDARALGDGLVAEARFTHRLPLTFHGIFTRRVAKG